jgi:serine protease Do
MAPGTTVDLTVIRDGDRKQIAVELGELPTEIAGIGGMRGGSPELRTGAFEGVRLSELNDQVRRQFDIPENVEGVLVTDVQPDSAAYAAGLRPGEIIVSVERKSVSSVNEAIRAARTSEDNLIVLRVWSDGGGRWIVVDTSKQKE